MIKVKSLKEFKGGSMARTFLISKKGYPFVRKIAKISETGLGHTKLKSQYNWIRNFNLTYPGILPHVDFFVYEKETCYYDMEFINAPTFRDYLVGNNDYDKSLTHDILNFGAVISAVDKSHKENKDKYIIEKHINKWVDRCKLISESPIYTSDYLVINGKKLKNLKLLIEEIAENKDLMELLKPKRWYRSHGDFTLQNMLVDEEGIRIIDPRGEGADSIYYDISKIYQSVHGKYDLLYDGNYAAKAYIVNNHTENYTAIDYVIKSNVEKFNMLFDQFRNLIPEYYPIEDDNWEIITKFFEGSHFISMTPFRLKENDEITYICYAIGIEILNEVLEEFKNES